eukprot:scaffold5063_cov127-Isochrysis_galbana.AAC.5
MQPESSEHAAPRRMHMHGLFLLRSPRHVRVRTRQVGPCRRQRTPARAAETGRATRRQEKHSTNAERQRIQACPRRDRCTQTPRSP